MFGCVKFTVAACLLFCAANTAAESLDEKEHAGVELGGVASQDITNKASFDTFEANQSSQSDLSGTGELE
jgi:hypothetical protein